MDPGIPIDHIISYGCNIWIYPYGFHMYKYIPREKSLNEWISYDDQGISPYLGSKYQWDLPSDDPWIGLV